MNRRCRQSPPDAAPTGDQPSADGILQCLRMLADEAASLQLCRARSTRCARAMAVCASPRGRGRSAQPPTSGLRRRAPCRTQPGRSCLASSSASAATRIRPRWLGRVDEGQHLGDQRIVAELRARLLPPARRTRPRRGTAAGTRRAAVDLRPVEAAAASARSRSARPAARGCRCTLPNGITSASTPETPPIMAARPMRTNWWIAAAPPITALSPMLTWPPMTTLLAMITPLPIGQSCATCATAISRQSAPDAGDAAAGDGAAMDGDVLAHLRARADLAARSARRGISGPAAPARRCRTGNSRRRGADARVAVDHHVADQLGAVLDRHVRRRRCTTGRCARPAPIVGPGRHDRGRMDSTLTLYRSATRSMIMAA